MKTMVFRGVSAPGCCSRRRELAGDGRLQRVMHVYPSRLGASVEEEEGRGRGRRGEGLTCEYVVEVVHGAGVAPV